MASPSADHYLFVYGTLAPGEVNAHVLAPLAGQWQKASVRGVLHAEGWGATYGFPALELDAAGNEVRGLLFHSSKLPEHWPRLDEFEGAAYKRVVADVALPSGESIAAYVYVINRERAET